MISNIIFAKNFLININSKQQMKKVFALLSIAAMLGGMTACGSNETKPAEEPQTEQTTPEEPAMEEQVMDTTATETVADTTAAAAPAH
jgi:predicted small lipoprotein YifL